MDSKKKKTYSKKPSKKERLAAELAQKTSREQEHERVEQGGVFVRADGVAVSQVALAARQKALLAALGSSPDAVVEKKPERSAARGRRKTDASPNIPKIEAPVDSGKRLAQCLWCAQILLVEVLQFQTAADKQVSRFLREHRELGARDRHIVAEIIYAILRHRRVFAHLAQSGQGALERRLVLLAAYQVVGRAPLTEAITEDEMTWLQDVIHAPIEQLPAAVRSNLPDEWFNTFVVTYGVQVTLTLT